MNETAGTSRLTDEQADEMLARYGVRYRHVESGESAYSLRGRSRNRRFGKGRLARSVKTRGR